jgi:hypothetical protein
LIQKVKTLLLIVPALVLSSCATSSSIKASSQKVEYLKMSNGTFTSPSDGMIFRLSLGKELNQDTGGITPVPIGIPGVRQATASFYSIEDRDGAGYGHAESSIPEGFEHCLNHVEIQHESSSGRILVTEDTSDALPCKRYILFTPTHPGYRVDYLAPDYESHLQEHGLPCSPPKVILLPQDRALIGDQILPISRIPKSKHPFSLGP